MSGIRLDNIAKAALEAPAGDKLRLSRTKNPGEITTAKYGFRNRVVRFFKGPTRQDRADNTKLLRDLLSGLKEKYGDNIGTQAFLRARPLAKVDPGGGGILVASNHRLTANQVKDAIGHASRQKQSMQSDAEKHADQFAPATNNFRNIKSGLGYGAVVLTSDQSDYFHKRLRENVMDSADRKGAMPSDGDVEAIAKKLLKHVVRNVGDGAGQLNADYDSAATHAANFLEELSRDNGDPVSAFTQLVTSAEDLVHDASYEVGDVGRDDRTKPFEISISRAVSAFSEAGAKRLYDKLMAPNGPGRQALQASVLAFNKTSFRDGLKQTAASQSMDLVVKTLSALSNRAGIGDQQVNTLRDNLLNGNQKSSDSSRVGNLLDQFDRLNTQRGRKLQQDYDKEVQDTQIWREQRDQSGGEIS